MTNSGPGVAGFSDGSTLALERLDSVRRAHRTRRVVPRLLGPRNGSLVGSELVDAIVQSGVCFGLWGLTSRVRCWGLAIASTDPDGARSPVIETPVDRAVGRIGWGRSGAQAERFVADESRRQAIAELIDQRALRTVFQPVVRLPKAEICGYEALTRFDNGFTSRRRGEAHEVGLGLELEELCIDVALQSVDRLAPGCSSASTCQRRPFSRKPPFALAAYAPADGRGTDRTPKVTDYPAVRRNHCELPRI